MSAVVDELGEVKLFGGLSQRQLRQLARLMKERTFRPGVTVVEEGTMSGVGFFIVAEGEASVSVDGREVARIGPGDHFGELAAVDWGASYGRPRLANVVATAPGRLLVLDWQLLNWLMGAAPDVGRTIERTSRARMAEL